MAAGAAVLTALLAGQATAGAQETQERTTTQQGRDIKESTTTSVTATVKSIDKSTRRVTLETREGKTMAVQVPEKVKGFDKLKKGDTVDIDYYQSMAVAVMPPGSGPPSRQERTMTREGMAGREVTATVKIIEVQPDQNMVTFKGADGEMHTVEVKNPEMQAKLRELKPGDSVQITYTEAVAASIRTRSKMQNGDGEQQHKNGKHKGQQPSDSQQQPGGM
jgi:hypothetical protein